MQSDYLINWPPSLAIHLSNFLKTFVIHGTAPHFILCTLLPLVKDNLADIDISVHNAYFLKSNFALKLLSHDSHLRKTIFMEWNKIGFIMGTVNIKEDKTNKRNCLFNCFASFFLIIGQNYHLFFFKYDTPYWTFKSSLANYLRQLPPIATIQDKKNEKTSRGWAVLSYIGLCRVDPLSSNNKAISAQLSLTMLNHI